MVEEENKRLKEGLYEQVINESLFKKMDFSKQFYDCKEINKAESSLVLSKYLSNIIEKGLSHFPKDDTKKHLELTNKIISSTLFVTCIQLLKWISKTPRIQ